MKKIRDGANNANLRGIVKNLKAPDRHLLLCVKHTGPTHERNYTIYQLIGGQPPATSRIQCGGQPPRVTQNAHRMNGRLVLTAKRTDKYFVTN